jgi:short-subunit dehydrogenase
MTELLRRYGPRALVLGASEGIGAAFARVLAEAGFDLVLIARRMAPLDALAAELRERFHVSVEARALDLACADLEAQFAMLGAQHEIGLVVYNAALSVVAPFLDTPLEEKQRMLDVNARGPLLAAHVFGKAMAERGRGGIVLLSSLTAFWGSPWLATYGATKAFNLALGEALAHELGERGVDVLVACAGATRTPGFVQRVAVRDPASPAPASMEPDAVAREALRALPGRGAFVPGASTRWAQRFLTRLLPRRTAIRIMAGHTKPLLGQRK